MMGSHTHTADAVDVQELPAPPRAFGVRPPWFLMSMLSDRLLLSLHVSM